MTQEKVENVTPDAAKSALDSIAIMERAGQHKAVPSRWLGIGVGILVASLFALYALEDPYPYIVFPIIALGVFVVAMQDKSGAYARVVPGTKSNTVAFLIFTGILGLVFFGSVFLRRAYDAPWISLVAGLLVGLVIFWISESERRFYLAKLEEEQV